MLRPAAERLGGRIGELRGDGALLRLPAPRRAPSGEWAGVAHAAPRPPACRREPLALRIAIHMGEIVVSEDGLFGDAVNLTARLQEHAPPGGTVVSEPVRRALRGAPAEQVIDLGLLRFKNDERPFRAYALGTGHAGPRPRPAGTVPAIAVLPLTNHGGDPADDYLAAGIMEDIILSLSGLRELTVIARGSTAGFSAAGADPRATGRALGVRYVLTGSLRRGGTAIRVATQLIDVESGEAVWSDRQEGRGADVFDLQDRIVQRVVAGMAPHLRASEIAPRCASGPRA